MSDKSELNDLLRTIKFKDKEDSNIINSDSTYVLTAENINHIKTVVNNLADELSRRLRFYEVFKFSKFNIPQTLKNNCKYVFELELSESPIFENSKSIRIATNNIEYKKYFEIFEDDVWKNFESLNRDINFSDANKSLKVDLSNFISDTFKPYFGRCRWININTDEYQEFQGFSLGIFEYNDKDFDNKYITNFYIEGNTSIKEGEEHNYNVLYTTNEGKTFNVTKQSKLTTLNGICSFTDDILKVPALHTNNIEIIKAEYVYDNIKFIAFLNVSLNPIILEDLTIVGDLDLIKIGEEKIFGVKAKYSDGSQNDVTDSCDKILSLGNCELLSNKIIGKGCFDEFGSLIINYTDENFKNENVTKIKYIKYEIDKYENLIITLPEKISGDEKDLTFKVELKLSNKNDLIDVTSTVKINLIDCDELSFTNDGKIIINYEKIYDTKLITGIVEYSDENCGYNIISKTFNILIDPIFVKDIQIEFYDENKNKIFETNELSRIHFKVFEIYNDGSKKEINTNDEKLNIEYMTMSNFEINRNSGIITLDKFEFSEMLMFNNSYTKNNKTFNYISYLYVYPIKLKLLRIKNFDSNVKPDVEYSFDFEVLYSDNTIRGIQNNYGEFLGNFEMKIAAGNPNLIKEINKNKIIFNSPETKQESLTIIATYIDNDFETEKQSVFFVVNIIK